MAIALITLGLPPDGLGARLAEGLSAPVEGTLSPAALEAAEGAWRALSAPRARLLHPGSEAALARREREVALALAGLLQGPGRLRERLAWLRGRTDARGEPLDLALDTRTERLRGLPWELLEVLAPGEFAAAGARVLRLAEAARVAEREPAEVLEVLLWSPDPADAVTAALAARLEAGLSAMPGIEVRRLDPARTADLAPAAARVLHVICHGRALADQVALQICEESVSADSARRGLATGLEGVALVVLDVCGAAGAAQVEGAPVWRLVATAAPAAIGPTLPSDADAALAFDLRMYAALSRGRPLVEAVGEGRAAMAALTVPHLDSRWWIPQVVLADVGRAEVALALPSPPGWPVAAGAARSALRRAWELGERQGYVGVEQLLASLLDAAPGAPGELDLARRDLRELVAELSPLHTPPSGATDATPRLTALRARLAPGFDLAALTSALLDVPWVARRLHRVPSSFRSRPEADPGATLTLNRPCAPCPAVSGDDGLALEVWGGPEDGRTLVLREVGQDVGRWDPHDPALREHRLIADRSVSRRHIVWLGASRVQILGRTWRLDARARLDPISGEVDLRPGDVIRLGAALLLQIIHDDITSI